MGMGSLATVGLQKPANLTIVVLDNEVYGETGGQASHTAATVDLVGVARACGIADARAMATMAEIEAFASVDAGRRPAGRALPASRSTAPIWSACSPAATALSS